MKKCLIISGGEFSGFENPANTSQGVLNHEPRISGDKISEYSLIIAADKGALYAGRLGIFPDVVIGDFDSCEEADVAGKFLATKPERELPSAGDIAAGEEAAAPEIIRLPHEKDYSDTFFAVKYALERGFLNIDFICVMGGRFDHMISNLQTAAYAASYGARCRLFGERDIIHVICGRFGISCQSKNTETSGKIENTQISKIEEDDAKTRDDSSEPFGQVTIKKRAGWSVSAFALSEKCEGVRISGSKYDNGAETTSLEVENTEKGAAPDGLTLHSILPQGLSNEFAEGSSEITFSFKKGILAVIESRF